MSTSFLLLSYSAKILRPLAENSSDKDSFLTKAQGYEGNYLVICVFTT